MSNTVTVKIEIKEGMTAERSLKKFKRLCESYGVSKEYKKRKSYSKPSILKKEKREAAEKRRLKLIRKSSGRRSKI
ncbi:30S ribosomal protein S21 [Halobacteriovorax sp. GB3]|uniref:30S ribosomal protein S21 n=1 Tax=Halobacteriovorax sp. GB3 TaxID=2719615 RepID=UPI00235ECA81|nr:30S ribosomal protein S21 [Halobacteriovorax sp. GB3]MDD0854152.1 30S ribosomal protein S21 [Halobacteriovorax sp. GB3]